MLPADGVLHIIKMFTSPESCNYIKNWEKENRKEEE